MRKWPITKMLRAALAEYTRAESRSLPCGERQQHLRKARKIDERLRDYAIRAVNRRGTLLTATEMKLLTKLNRMSSGVGRMVQSVCGSGYHKGRRFAPPGARTMRRCRRG